MLKWATEPSELYAQYFLIAIFVVILIMLIWSFVAGGAEGMGNMVYLQKSDDMIGFGRREGYSSYQGAGAYATPQEMDPIKAADLRGQVLVNGVVVNGEQGYDNAAGYWFKLGNGPVYKSGGVLLPQKDRPKYYAVVDSEGKFVVDTLGYVQFRTPVQMQEAASSGLIADQSALRLLRTPWQEAQNLQAYGSTCKVGQLVAGDPWSWVQRSATPSATTNELVAGMVGTQVGSAEEGMDAGDPLLVASMMGR